jgi:hypothetical protein
LHRSHHVLLLSGGSFAKRRRPREILRQIIQHRWELREGFDRRIPGLLVDSLGECLSRQAGIIFDPKRRCDDFIGERGSAQNLRDKRVRIQGNGRHE